MPAVGAIQNSWNIPSIGQILRAVPRAWLGVAAVLGGISNARSAVSASPGQHGGGLNTEAHALWQSNWLPSMQACLSQSQVHRFEPGRAIVDCVLQGIAHWQQDNDDIYAAEVVTRGVEHYHLQSPHPVPDAPGSTPGGLKKVVREVGASMRRTDAYKRTMDQAETLLWFHSSMPLPDSPDPKQPYTVDGLIRSLDDAIGVQDFMEEACPLSYGLNVLAKREGELTYRLKPELLRFQADREAFENNVDGNFVGPSASMDHHQLRTLLSLLARHLNEKYLPIVN